MNRLFMPFVAVAVAASAAVASPEGLEIFVNVSLESADADWFIVDSLNPFAGAAHNLGGAATLLTAQVDFVTDVLVTSTVSTVGNLRTITVNYESVTGGNIFRSGHEGLFQTSEFFWLSFQCFGINDPERSSLVTYTNILLDVHGNDVVDGFQYEGFLDDLGFVDDASLASSDFFGIAVRGLSVEMTYTIPAPASLGLLSLAALATRRRR